jgi:hypothetical protein
MRDKKKYFYKRNMANFSILKGDDGYTLKGNILRSNRDSIQRLFHRTGPVVPLLHWMEYQYLLYHTQYFKFQYLIISALCTSFASFNTSRSRFPTDKTHV